MYLEQDKIPYVELFEYNFTMSILDYFIDIFSKQEINGKKLEVAHAHFDANLSYITPSLIVENLYRRNRSIGFGNYYGDIEHETGIIEIEGMFYEYRMQLNVYSNTRGENYKWCSILDEVLKQGEKGIPINTYLDNGEIKQSNIGNISYDYASDVRNNPMPPNIVTYDHHTIYEVKMLAIQQYRAQYHYMEIGDIIGKIKKDKFMR